MVAEETPGPVGVVLHDGGAGSEELLARFAAALRLRGWNVGGLVQRTLPVPDGKNRMELVDVRTGEVFVISQKLGSGSSACCLDPAGLAEASRVLRREIADGVDLLVVNKFAGAECDGDGLAPETFEAIGNGIPVLTTLALRYRDRWDAITGGAGQMLPPDEPALWRWWESVRPSSPQPDGPP